MLAMRFVPGLVPNGPAKIWMVSAFGPFLVGLLVMLWWCLASRARWFERGLGVIGLAAAVVVEQLLCQHSMRGPLLIVMTLPMGIATPEKLVELAQLPAMSGKTWNHPVVVGDRLYVRNAEEAICYKLRTAD